MQAGRELFIVGDTMNPLSVFCYHGEPKMITTLFKTIEVSVCSLLPYFDSFISLSPFMRRSLSPWLGFSLFYPYIFTVTSPSSYFCFSLSFVSFLAFHITVLSFLPHVLPLLLTLANSFFPSCFSPSLYSCSFFSSACHSLQSQKGSGWHFM